jgi:hypothetical protein
MRVVHSPSRINVFRLCLVARRESLPERLCRELPIFHARGPAGYKEGGQVPANTFGQGGQGRLGQSTRTMPRWMATVVAWLRSLTPSFSKMFIR